MDPVACTFSVEVVPRRISGAAYMKVPVARCCEDKPFVIVASPTSATFACQSRVSRMLLVLTSLRIGHGGSEHSLADLWLSSVAMMTQILRQTK